jgi:hypothetical protein
MVADGFNRRLSYESFLRNSKAHHSFGYIISYKVPNYSLITVVTRYISLQKVSFRPSYRVSQ